MKLATTHTRVQSGTRTSVPLDVTIAGKGDRDRYRIRSRGRVALSSASLLSQKGLTCAAPTSDRVFVARIDNQHITPLHEPGFDDVLKRPPKTPDKAYPVAKNQEYACVYDWNDRTS